MASSNETCELGGYNLRWDTNNTSPGFRGVTPYRGYAGNDPTDWRITTCCHYPVHYEAPCLVWCQQKIHYAWKFWYRGTSLCLHSRGVYPKAEIGSDFNKRPWIPRDREAGWELGMMAATVLLIAILLTVLVTLLWKKIQARKMQAAWWKNRPMVIVDEEEPLLQKK
jgi:hypothetical protein